MKLIYLDHAATTPLAKEVLQAMEPFLTKKYGNASSLHGLGREAREAVEHSREKILKRLNALEYQLVFTSGGTEANNLALKGVALANQTKGKHLITTQIEHESVLQASHWLEKQGFEVTYLEVDKEGFVSPEELRRAIRQETILVSIIHGNNEIGTIQNLKSLGQICQEKGVYFHTDACQSFGKVPLDLNEIKVDLMTINAHKIHGPKGIGALMMKKGIKLEPLLHGGGQEFKLRSGTENVAGMVGFAQAAETVQEKEMERVAKLRDFFIKEALKMKDCRLNGPQGRGRLSHNANLSFRNVEGESLILHLDLKGIAVSTGSACSSLSLEPSHVLLAIGLKPEEAHGSVRFSLGKETTLEEIKYTLKVLKEIVNNLRKISPFG